MSAPQTPVAPRTFMDQVAGTWHTSSEPVWIGAGVIGLFQSFMTYRLLDIKDAGSVLSVPWWVTFTAISITPCCCVAAGRSSQPSPPGWSC